MGARQRNIGTLIAERARQPALAHSGPGQKESEPVF